MDFYDLYKGIMEQKQKKKEEKEAARQERLRIKKLQMKKQKEEEREKRALNKDLDGIQAHEVSLEPQKKNSDD